VINRGNLDALEQFWEPDFSWHGIAGPIEGLVQLRRVLAAYATGVPDQHVEEGFLIGEGDLVAGQWTARGTHTGELFRVPATRASLEYQALDVYRLRHGKIVEQWAGDDVMSLLQQIGVLPPPPRR
jgi:predicted ester cyclase